jgi:signal peptidase II
VTDPSSPIGRPFYAIALLLTTIDQLTKLWVVRAMELGESRPVLDGFLKLTYVHNAGAAFGLDLGGRWSFILVTILVATFIVFYYARSERTRTARWALALILGGALGNLIDRIRLGEVVDFLHLSISTASWPIFNVADIGVTVGVGLLAIHLFRREHPDVSEIDGGAPGGVRDGDTPASRSADPAGEETGSA